MKLLDNNLIVCRDAEECDTRQMELRKFKVWGLAPFSGGDKTMLNEDHIYGAKSGRKLAIEKLARLKALETARVCVSCGVSGKQKIPSILSLYGDNLFCSEECEKREFDRREKAYGLPLWDQE